MVLYILRQHFKLLDEFKVSIKQLIKNVEIG